MTDYNPQVWGPHYWFVLYTIASTYPDNPNEFTKRKYYDFIQNMPLFIPNISIGNHFSEMLDKFPCSPYLSSRDSFKKWVHFIHNKINIYIGKDEMSFLRADDIYKAHYRPQPVILSETLKIKKHHIYLLFTLCCIIFIYIFYKEA